MPTDDLNPWQVLDRRPAPLAAWFQYQLEDRRTERDRAGREAVEERERTSGAEQPPPETG
jgi:hypothetical protein